jgi:ABC-2 type transport system permease protein
VATLFITAEYRRGLILTTLTASPRRGRVLAAKAIVIGAATFVTGLAAALVAVPLGEHELRANGNYLFPTSPLTELRVIVGTAALLAIASILALALGAVLRRSAGAITAVVVTVAFPYTLAIASPVLPDSAAQWLLRLTPAAGFSIQQSLHQYAQVSHAYTPANGYFPLAPWGRPRRAQRLRSARHGPRRLPGAQARRVSRALHAEWTKLRTTSGAIWLALASVGLTVAVTSAAAMTVARGRSPGSPQDTTKLSLVGITLSQAVVAILAVLAISSEYSTGMIRVTLTAIPRRTALLAAKASVLAGTVLPTATAAVLGSLLAGRLILPARGFTPAHGYALLSLAHGPTLRAAAGSILYLTLIALLSIGIATAVRDSAAAIGIILGLLYLFPILTALVSDPTWQRHLQQIGPMSAGLSIQSTTDLGSLPIGPWAGLGVVAAWAAAALLAGGLLLRRRDA